MGPEQHLERTILRRVGPEGVNEVVGGRAVIVHGLSSRPTYEGIISIWSVTTIPRWSPITFSRNKNTPGVLPRVIADRLKSSPRTPGRGGYSPNTNALVGAYLLETLKKEKKQS